MPIRPKPHHSIDQQERKKAIQQHYESSAQRKADRAFYNSKAWRSFRAWFLARNPLCADHFKAGKVVPAQHVHHKKERKKFPELSFVESNCEGLCTSCHSSEEARRRGGVGL